MIFNGVTNWAVFGWFLFCWVGYTFYAKIKAKNRNCLSAILYQYRVDWMQALLRHDNRVPDLILLSGLVQMVNFLASTTILVLAGAITVMYSADNVVELLEGHAFIAPTTQEQVQFKVLTLCIIFVYAFFRFTWAMRQHTFCSILIGAAPYVQGDRELTEDEKAFAFNLAKISDRAAHEFNYGLRSFYFALSFLTWFVNPWIFAASCTMVVVVLYLREFRSKTLSYLVRSRQSFVKIPPSCAAPHALPPAALWARDMESTTRNQGQPLQKTG